MSLLSTCVLGIDPGLTGQICRLNIETLVPEFFPIPTVGYRKIVKCKNGKRLLEFTSA